MAEEQKKNLRFEHVEETVDVNTGEIVSHSRRSVVQIDKEPDYVKLYLKDIIRLKDLPKSTGSVLNALLRSMGYNNIIPAYKPIKKIMSADLGISLNTMNKAIDNLHKAGVLIRVDRGLYMADPELFGRGTWQSIKMIRMMITYGEDGTKQISADVEKDQLKLF